MNITELFETLKSCDIADIYIVGAGKYGKVLGAYFDKNGVMWGGYIDKNSMLKQINGKPVFPYHGINKKKSYYVISSYLYKDEMIQELKKFEITQEQIIICDNDTIYELYDDIVCWRKYTRKIKEYKDKHKGKRCFIIGNGPSLKLEDLEDLKGEITFACNSIYALFEHTSWRPDYYCVWDEYACKEMLSKREDMERLLSNCHAFFTSIMSEGFQYRNYQNMDNLYFVKPETEKDLKTGLPLFSHDCSMQVYISGTVAYMMLQLAAYMGFNAIYLLGIDCSYSIERNMDGSITRNDISNYNDLIQIESGKEKAALEAAGLFPEVDMMINGYKSAKQYADLHGIKIYNATRGGKLEVFERVNFDSLISKN